MECKKIQELLLTDYPDGEVRGRLKNKVEEHLRTCLECRQFEHTLRREAIEPFKNSIKIKPRASVWNRITEAIVLEERRKSEGFIGKIQDFFRRIFSMPRIAYTLATVITVLFILVMAIKFQPTDHKVVTMQPKEEIEYLTYLMGEAEYFVVDENGGYSTAIEEYFL